MSIKSEQWLKRAKELLAQSAGGGAGSEQAQFATSMLTAFYGPQSMQVKAFLDRCAAISKAHNADYLLYLHSQGAIRNAVAEIEHGLVTSMRAQVAGEVLSELVRLGKEILSENTEAAKNVAAVLIAAAFEDIIRRMGTEFAAVTGRPDLQEIITALKNADVLKGGQVGLAQGYLKFRNDSLHADWNKVDRSQVQSCIGFIEELLLKHFS